MATASLITTLPQPTLIFIDNSTSSRLITTLTQPTISFIVNDWSVVVNIPLPTISANLLSGNSYALSKTLEIPTLNSSSIVGSILAFNKNVPNITLESRLSLENYYTFTSLVPNITLNISSFNSSLYTLNKVLRLPKFLITSNNVVLSTQFKTYALNTKNIAHTEYTNYNFNSYFKLANIYYGVTNTGIYKLTGDLDIASAIQTEVALPISSFDKQGMKACQDAIILGRLVGDMEVQLVFDEQEAREGFIVTSDTREGLHRIRVRIPKGLKGAVVQPKLKNVDGSNFSINNLELFIKELQRIR